MRLLLHICCAPCTIYPLNILRGQKIEVHGLFYNPNIHPYSEYEKRKDALRKYAGEAGLEVIFPHGYPMEDFLRMVAFRENERCRDCYYSRLKYTASVAQSEGFDCFSTTLLYSKYQKHEIIRQIGERLAEEHGIEFHYQDFREGWREGIEISKRLNMYRQKYCGCIYSEKDRFFREDLKVPSR